MRKRDELGNGKRCIQELIDADELGEVPADGYLAARPLLRQGH